MEKVIQEFRIIETDDGFRIEIKGDKEQLRDFVMNLDPRHGMRRGPGWGFPFGPPAPPRMGRRLRWGFGPFGPWGWDDEDDDEDDDDRPRRRKGRRHHHHHDHGEHHDKETV